MVPYAGILRRDPEAHARSADFEERYLQNRLKLDDAAQGLDMARTFVASPLHILLGMVCLLLLLTCVNVADLLVIRSARREKEIAARCSLGASRFAVIRLVLVECLLLSASGSTLGLLVARVGTELLVRMIPADSLGLVFKTTPDWRILGFTAALAVLTAMFFGLAPAFQAARSPAGPP